jgi:hypothetical protein
MEIVHPADSFTGNEGLIGIFQFRDKAPGIFSRDLPPWQGVALICECCTACLDQDQCDQYKTDLKFEMASGEAVPVHSVGPPLTPVVINQNIISPNVPIP